jgi:MFS family permease
MSALETAVGTASPAKLGTVMPAGLVNMFTLGASTTFYGPSLVYIAGETGVPVASLGVLFAFHWAGFFVSAFMANRIARRFEMRRGAMFGVLLIVLGALGLLLLPFPLNITMAFLVGLGNGTSEVLFNRLVELLAGNKPAQSLTQLHSTWGVGAIAIPLVVAGVALLGWNWRAAGVFVIACGVANIALIARWGAIRVSHGEPVQVRRLPWNSLALFMALFAVYTGVETAIGAWATTFFAKLGQGAILGSIATSVFFLTFSFGRLLFASATDRLGFGRTVRIGTVAGAAALALTFFPSLALFGFALTGVAVSIVFPTLLAWAPRRHPEIRAQMMSLSLAATGVGGIILPALIGISVGAIGAWTLTPLLIATLAVVAFMSLYAREGNSRVANG